ncbi:MAG: ATP-binding protein [Thermoplasmatota archaeon]
MGIGRITGRNVGELRFRVGPDEDVHLGQILLTTCRDRPFYLRVVDIEYGADDGDQRWGERTAGNLLAGADDDLVLFDRERRLYRTVVASPLGYLDDGFRKPKTLPDHFAAVERPRPGDFTFLSPAEGDLVLGALRSGDDALDDRIGLDPRALAQHVGIFATTGMGKSNLLKVLAGSCLDSGQVGLLVLDPHGEYADGGGGMHRDGTAHRGLLHHHRQDRLVVYTSRPLLGFEGRIHDLAMAATEIEVADFQSVFHVSEAQSEALWAARQEWQDRWLIELGRREPEALFLHFNEKFHRSTWNVLQRRAAGILDQSVIHGDGTTRSTTQSILQHLESGMTVLVDTSALEPNEELLVSATLARKLLRRYQQAYREPERFRNLAPACVVLEEAQRVLNQRAGSNNVFAQIAREGRKFRVGLGAVTQQPRLISDELLSQFNTLFILGLADPTDRERVRGGSRQDLSQLVKEIQMLEPGEALLTTPGAPFALPLMVDLYEDRIQEAETKAATRVDASFY